MVMMLVICAYGIVMARLNRRTSEGGTVVAGPPAMTPADVPDDLWSAFDAVAAAHEQGSTRTTVGAMTAGSRGYVSTDAVQRDISGALWLDAAAIVHPAPGSGRVPLHRDEDGYRMHRKVDDTVTPVGGSLRARVRVAALFD